MSDDSRHQIEGDPSILTIRQQVAVESEVDAVAPPIFKDGGIEDDILAGFMAGSQRDVNMVQVDLTNRESANLNLEVIAKTLEYAADTHDTLYLSHAYEGHEKRSVDRAFIRIIQALKAGEAKFFQTERTVRLQKTYGDDEIVKIPRIVVQAPVIEATKHAYLFEEAGELIRELPDRKKGQMILEYSRAFGLNFGIMTAICAGVTTSEIVKLYSDKQKTEDVKRASLVSKNGATIARIHEELWGDGDHITLYGLRYDNAVRILLGSNLGQNIGLAERVLIQDRYPLEPFLFTPTVVFMTKTEMILKYARADFRDPMRTDFALRDKFRRTLITKPITAYNKFERKKSGGVIISSLGSGSVDDINKYLLKLREV